MNDVLPEPRLEGSYRLARGRRIGFAEWGRADGVPVLWFKAGKSACKNQNAIPKKPN
jgi:hypothetical protein